MDQDVIELQYCSISEYNFFYLQFRGYWTIELPAAAAAAENKMADLRHFQIW